MYNLFFLIWNKLGYGKKQSSVENRAFLTYVSTKFKLSYFSDFSINKRQNFFNL